MARPHLFHNFPELYYIVILVLAQVIPKNTDQGGNYWEIKFISVVYSTKDVVLFDQFSILTVIENCYKKISKQFINNPQTVELTQRNNKALNSVLQSIFH